MRKYNYVVTLTAVLCLAAILLSGCAARQTDTHTVTPAAVPETAAPTAAASTELVPDASHVPLPDSNNTATASPEPIADANSIPVRNSQNRGEIYDILADAYENFHFGTAGSSLTGMRLSASLMDWGIANGVEAVRAGAAEYDLGEKDEFDESLCVKLIDMMYRAVNMTADALDCAGYEARYDLPYAVSDINAIYGAVFEARGWEPMNIMRVYRSDDNAEHFLYSGIFVDGDAVNTETLNYALWHDVPADGAAISTLKQMAKQPMWT